MKTATCLIALLSLALFACSEETPLDVTIPQSLEQTVESSGIESPPDAPVQNSRPMVPFHAFEENTIVALPPFPCLPPDFPELCDELQPILHSEFPGVITGTHIGNATILGVAESDLTTGAQTGRSVITTANGDQLVWESFVIGVISPDGSVVFDGEFWFTPEGTGRFANASGGGTVSGTASLIDSVGQFEMHGMISYGPRGPRNVRAD